MSGSIVSRSRLAPGKLVSAAAQVQCGEFRAQRPVWRPGISAMGLRTGGKRGTMADRIQIRMGGYGPATTGFSKSLKFIGDRLEQQFGDRIDVKYVWNIM